MNITCIAEKLIKAVAQVEKLATKQASLPVLAGILLEAKGTTLKLRATNLHVGVEIEIGAQVDSEGVVAVDAQIMQRILSNLGKEKKITLSLQNENILISTESSELLVKTYPHEDFPTLPKVVEGQTLSLPVEDFMDGIQSVFYSASRSDIKPEISSVFMYSDNGKLVFVATDSFRLAEKKVSVKILPEFEGVLIPVKNVIEIIRLIGTEKGNLEVLLGENQISFHVASLYCTSRLVDGSFPDYRQIIPKTKETSVILLVEELKQALRMISIFSDKYNQIDCEIVPEKKECIIRSTHSDVGSSMVAISSKIEGPAFNSRLNHTYMSDMFQSLKKDSLEMAYGGPEKPLIVKGVHDDNFTYLIMPMNR